MSDRYAFVDESYIVATRHYLLAAVVVREDMLDDVRASVRAVRRRRRDAFHWHGEFDRSRTAMLELIAATHGTDRGANVVEHVLADDDGGQQVVPGHHDVALVDEGVPVAHDVDRCRTDSNAASALSSASGRVCRYFWVVMIWAWPMRSMTDLRSAPPARSQEAWAWRRSCMRTWKSMPERCTAGFQYRVLNVARDRGWPPAVSREGKSRSSGPRPSPRMRAVRTSRSSWETARVRDSLSLG